MNFKEAESTVLPFGKYRDRTIDSVASTDEGLRYLDWLIGQDNLYGEFKEALEVYLGDQSIQEEVVKAVEDG